MTYVDQKSFHYNKEFSHIKSYEFGNGKILSMFADDDLKCVIETRQYASDYSECDIKQIKTKLSFENANTLFEDLISH